MSIQTDVEVVLLTWKRPNNVPIIIDAFREQSYPCLITLIDNAPSKEFELPEEVTRRADKFFRIPVHPFHSSIQYVSFGFYEKRYVFFYDDDHVPGKECVRHFRDYAEANPDCWLFSQKGGDIRRDWYDDYKSRKFKLNELVTVQVCHSACFTRLEIAPYFRQICQIIYEKGLWELFVQDDVVLAYACMLAEKGIHLLPKLGDETNMVVRDLPHDFAIHRRAGQIEARKNSWKEFEEIMYEIGFGMWSQNENQERSILQ